MRPFQVLALVLSLLFLGSGCTAEDKRQWHEALKDLRGDNMELGSHDRHAPVQP
jgi:hypothetical protein